MRYATVLGALLLAATFAPVETRGESFVGLRVIIEGKGVVTSAPDGVACPTRCEARFRVGTVVTLSATPHPKAEGGFLGWSGGCEGAQTMCRLTLDGSVAEVIAAFDYPCDC